MRATRWIACLWPGLVQLWCDGAWSGLALASGFSLLLNLLLAASFIWCELLEPAVLRWGWLALGLAWIGSLLVLAWNDKARLATIHAPSQEDLFRQALAEYLKGAWFEAEALLCQLLAVHPRDVDAQLMLATLLRHTQRYQEAEAALNVLRRQEPAAKWHTEIEHEKQLLVRMREQPAGSVGLTPARAAAGYSRAA